MMAVFLTIGLIVVAVVIYEVSCRAMDYFFGKDRGHE